MTHAENEVWREHTIGDHAPMVAEATGCSLAEALERTRSDLAELLPAGLDSPGVLLLAVLDESGRQVGVAMDRPAP